MGILLLAAIGTLAHASPVLHVAGTGDNNLVFFIFLIMAIALVPVLVFMGRFTLAISFRFALRFLRVFNQPVRLITRRLRRIGLISTPRNATPFLGPIFRAFTETDEAIESGGFDPDTVTLHRHRYIFCTWLRPLTASEADYAHEQAALDFEQAKTFFRFRLPMTSNPLNAHEDIDNALIVSMFTVDKRCFYVLSEFRKVIFKNVVSLLVLFALIVCMIGVVNVFFSSAIDFSRFLTLPGSISLLGMTWQTADVLNKFVFGIVSCAFGLSTMFLFFYADYDPIQRHNGQQMNNYLARYLKDISIKMKLIQANAIRSAHDEDYNAQQDVIAPITTLQWMAFRTFFIQLFLRNVLYQIHRNAVYMVLLVPILFIIAMSLTAYLLGIRELNPFDLQSAVYQHNSFYVFYLLLAFSYYKYARWCLSPIWKSIEDQGEWREYVDLDIVSAMTKIMEANAMQLDQWRSRFRDQVGAPGIGA